MRLEDRLIRNRNIYRLIRWWARATRQRTFKPATIKTGYSAWCMSIDGYPPSDVLSDGCSVAITEYFMFGFTKYAEVTEFPSGIRGVSLPLRWLDLRAAAGDGEA